MTKLKLGIIVGIMVLFFIAPFALAEGTKLSIDEIKSYVDGKKDSGDIKADPESNLKFKVTIKNDYDEDVNDIEITDIVIKVTIKNIDDGEDLEEESDDFDLDAGDDETETIEFDIPLEVDEDEYEILIEVEGEDGENRTLDHLVSETIYLDIDKEKYDVRIRRAELTTPILKCARSTSLDVNIMNLGTEDIEDATLKITSAELELSKQETFDLDSDPFDEDSKYSTMTTISVGEDQLAGIYPINVRVDFDSRSTEKVLELEVQECVRAKPEPEEDPEEEEEEVVVEIEEPEVITQPPVVISEPTTEEPEEKETSLISTPVLIALIIGVDLLIIIIGVALIVGLSKKR